VSNLMLHWFSKNTS